MTDLSTYMILCKTLDNLKAQVWHHQDELIKLREQYKLLETERDRLCEERSLSLIDFENFASRMSSMVDDRNRWRERAEKAEAERDRLRSLVKEFLDCPAVVYRDDEIDDDVEDEIEAYKRLRKKARRELEVKIISELEGKNDG